MRHFATPAFWAAYRTLPASIQQLADKNFALLKENPRHPSLRLKKVGDYYSARVGLNYRAVATSREEGLLWFWIGSYDAYDRLLK